MKIWFDYKVMRHEIDEYTIVRRCLYDLIATVKSKLSFDYFVMLGLVPT